jgi:putative transposase
MGHIPLSRVMQNLSFRYTRWVNWRQNRSGHLFQGRYRAVLVNADAYLLALTRYIHLNPVRAGIAKTPEKYVWSGHRAYLGLKTIPWLSTDWVLSHFSKKVPLAREAYRRFVHDGMGEAHQEQYHRGSGIDGRILGDDDFVERVSGEKPMKPRRKTTLDRIMLEVCRYFHVKAKDFFVSGKDRQLSVARGMAGWLTLELGVGTLTDLSRRTGRDVTTLSAGVKRLQIRSKTELKLAEAMDSLLKVVS